MTTLDLTRFAALTFDCYGTLIDWDRGITRWAETWIRRHGAACRPEDFLALFAEHETLVQRERPEALYPEILARVGRRIARVLGAPWSDADGRSFGASVGEWPPFPDAPSALRELARRYRLVVVSNVDRDSFARSAAALGVTFDAVVTAQDVGAYKPDPRMFEAAGKVVAEMGVAPEHTLHVAQSLYHDIVPAAEMGRATVWVNRTRGRAGEGATHALPDAPVRPDLEVETLGELARLVRDAWR